MKISRYQATGDTDRRQVRVKVGKNKKIILGDVFCVDDGGGAKQLLQLLGLEGLREALQRHQQELQLLGSAEGGRQVSLQGAKENLLKHFLWDLRTHTHTDQI